MCLSRFTGTVVYPARCTVVCFGMMTTAKMRKRMGVVITSKSKISAPTAVTAFGTALGYELFTTERGTARSAFS